jgi:YidC/Oxa1 family membrane protein insertase
MNNLNNQGMHPEDKNNLFLFMILALLIYFGFDHYILRPKMEALQATQQAEAQKKQEEFEAQREEVADFRPVEALSREEILAENPRIKISNEHVFGTINLKGARFDDLELRNHFVTLESKEHVSILTPPGSEDARYAEYGWVPANKNIKVPDRETLWNIRGGQNQVLSTDNPVTLYWDNGDGLVFEREMKLDDHFLITIDERIINKTDQSMVFYPYGLISQRGVPQDFTGRWIMHEGPIGYVSNELHEIPYEDLHKGGTKEAYGDSGWIGITEKYWLISILPPQEGPKTFRFIFKPAAKEDAEPLYQVDMLGQAYTVNPGESISYQNRLFAGAKRVQLLDSYEKELGVHHFDLSVDFGMWYFITKPFYYVLMYLNSLIGNFGITIIVFTVFLRGSVFPLANTSYRSFAKMKTIAPQMQEIREKYGDDKQKLQEALVELYQREKVNPMAGCFPILIQIPIFFSLYKVLSLAI